jgi:hypothetical protein
MWWYMPVIPALERLRQEDWDSRPVWGTQWDAVSKSFSAKKRRISISNLEEWNLDMVVHTCNPSTQEGQVGGWRVWGQSGYIVRPGLKPN